VQNGSLQQLPARIKIFADQGLGLVYAVILEEIVLEWLKPRFIYPSLATLISILDHTKEKLIRPIHYMMNKLVNGY